MSSKTNSYAGKGFSVAGSFAAVDTNKTIIIPGLPGVQAFCKTLHATGADAAATILAFAAKAGRKTTVKTATADAATTIVLDGDDDGLINGYTPTTSDYVLVATDATSADDIGNKGHGWRLLKIGGVTVTAASDQVSLTSLVGQDGHTGIEGIVSAGAVAYVISATQVSTITVGSASIDKENVVTGEVGHPIGFHYDPAAAALHDIAVSGVFE